MRKLPAAIALTVFLAGPTLAQAASKSAKMTGEDQGRSQNQTANEPGKMNGKEQNLKSFRQQVKNNLEQAGFSDIQIMPESFLVRAKDKNGNAVLMVLNPDSFTAVTEYKRQNKSISGSDNTSGRKNITGNED